MQALGGTRGVHARVLRRGACHARAETSAHCRASRAGRLSAARGGAEGLDDDAPPPINRRRLLAGQAVLICACSACASVRPAAAAAEPLQLEYTYQGGPSGPDSWPGMCAVGSGQSPVDLPARSLRAALPRRTADSAALSCDTAPLNFAYVSSAARVLNTGHGTMQVNLDPGNVCRVGRLRLSLLQYHFHAPSEHARGGVRAAMEAHLVHRNLETGGLAVVAVLMEPGGALPNPALAAALQHAPAAPRAEAPCPQPINPAQLLPGLRRYLHYQGSLTTPPCTEQVDWFVMDEPLRVAPQQVLDFQRYVGAGRTYATNARPLQPLNGRAINADCLQPEEAARQAPAANDVQAIEARELGLSEAAASPGDT